jgi:hypothetical protein
MVDGCRQAEFKVSRPRFIGLPGSEAQQAEHKKQRDRDRGREQNRRKSQRRFENEIFCRNPSLGGPLYLLCTYLMVETGHFPS